MKIICDVLDLTDALSKVTRALPSKVMIGVNNDGIKISAHGDTVVFTAIFPLVPSALGFR